MNYNTRYFIEKFEAIPEERWLDGSQGEDGGPRCAYGHCADNGQNGSKTAEGIMLTQIISRLTGLKPLDDSRAAPHVHTPARINNGDILQYQQPTPKQRTLAALYDVDRIESDELINSALIKSEGEKELVNA